MYELLLGAPPFCGKDAIETMSMHLDEKPLSFKEFNPEVTVSDQMETLVLRCLEKKPDKRFRSVGRFVAGSTGEGLGSCYIARSDSGGSSGGSAWHRFHHQQCQNRATDHN